MGIDAAQLRNLVVVPALQEVDLYSEAAVELLMGTAAQESRLRYLKQLGDGPALGVFQMEPVTYRDIFENFLAFRSPLRQRILVACQVSPDIPGPARLVWDLKLATLMARVHYLRVPASLPDAFDVHGLAHYWKDHYNTHLGAGTVDEFVENYRLVQ